jgi:hypothetical protein
MDSKLREIKRVEATRKLKEAQAILKEIGLNTLDLKFLIAEIEGAGSINIDTNYNQINVGTGNSVINSTQTIVNPKYSVNKKANIHTVGDRVEYKNINQK